MLTRFRAAGLVWPTLATLAALGVLLGLGTWQWQRMAWKNALVAEMREASRGAPIAIPELITTSPTSVDIASRFHVDIPEFRRVELLGRFDHEREAYAYTVRGRAGFLVFTPVKLENGKEVIVNRGFVSEALRERTQRPKSLVSETVVIRGFTRKPQADSVFTPDDDRARRITYGSYPSRFLPLPEGGSGGPPDELQGTYVEAERALNDTGWPRARTLDEFAQQIPNRHLEYALTWWGLALTLIGVYCSFAWTRLRVIR